jgi:nucleotide-binding universal stress UspA family protein
MEIQRILCPIDFSDFSRRALQHAAEIAARYDSEITLLHVGTAVPAAYVAGVGVPSAGALAPHERERLSAALERFADNCVPPGVPVRFEVSEGPAAAEILGKAAAMSASLVVLGARGRSGLGRVLLGSVSEAVLRKASCPVMTVPKAANDAISAPPGLFEHIVVGVDFSDCSIRALNYAMSLAQESNAKLTVVHVIERMPDLPREIHETVLAGPRNLEEFIASASQDRQSRLNDMIPDAVRAYCVVDTMVHSGTPYREILRVADEGRADLLVIGVRGRGAVDRAVFGSTADRLVRQASCPVLTLRSP